MLEIEFETKYLESLRCFLWMVVTKSEIDIVLSPHEHTLWIYPRLTKGDEKSWV